MNEQIIKFIDEDVDGCGTNVEVLLRVCGKDITVGTIDRIKDAISNYKIENLGEWDTDGCIDVAKEQLESEGYEVHFITPAYEICF